MMSDDLVKRLRDSKGWPRLGDRIEELEAKLAKAVDKTLDAANEYMIIQYGISALGHPLDRSRILAKLKGKQP